MSWKDWFHKSDTILDQTPVKVLPLSPRLFSGIDLTRLSAEVREFFEERAGIREFHGNQSREEAEAGAWEDIQHYMEAEKTWSFDEWLAGYSEN